MIHFATLTTGRVCKPGGSDDRRVRIAGFDPNYDLSRLGDSGSL
jgi:hypothetical protein